MGKVGAKGLSISNLLANECEQDSGRFVGTLQKSSQYPLVESSQTSLGS